MNFSNKGIQSRFRTFAEVDPSAFFTDYQLDLLRAMEMSRLQFVHEMKGLQAGLG